MTRDELEQGLVDAAEFLGAEVAVVDRAFGLALRLHNAEVPDRSQECIVGQTLPCHDVSWPMVEQATDAGQPQFRATELVAKRCDDEGNALPQVAVSGATTFAR